MPQQLLPTMLKLCNFACGILAIYAVFEQKFGVAIICIHLGLLAVSTYFLTWLMVSHLKFPHFKKIKIDEEEVHDAH